MKVTVIEDQIDLERLEGLIHKNLQAFYAVGRALMDIRDKELYLIKNGGEYQTFEAYCKGIWDFSRSRAYQLMESVEVRDNLLTQTTLEPANEKQQIRTLAKLGPDQQREAWQRAVETAPDGKVTAAHVYKIVKSMTFTEPVEEPEQKQEETEILSEAMIFADIAIRKLGRIMMDDPKRQEALLKVSEWISENLK